MELYYSDVFHPTPLLPHVSSGDEDSRGVGSSKVHWFNLQVITFAYF